MKKLLILTLSIFCFYGCRSTNSSSIYTIESDNLLTKDVFVLVSSSFYGLYSAYMDNVCNKGTYSIEFNGNKYSQVSASYTINRTDGGIKGSKTQVLEERNNLVTLTTTDNIDNDTTTPKNFQISLNQSTKQITFKNLPSNYTNLHQINDVDSLCQAYNTKFQTFESKYEVSVSPRKGNDLTVNGETFSTLYTKIQSKDFRNVKIIPSNLKNTDEDIDATLLMSSETWTATNGELNGFGIKSVDTFSDKNSDTTLMNSYSFTK